MKSVDLLECLKAIAPVFGWVGDDGVEISGKL